MNQSKQMLILTAIAAMLTGCKGYDLPTARELSDLHGPITDPATVRLIASGEADAQIAEGVAPARTWTIDDTRGQAIITQYYANDEPYLTIMRKRRYFDPVDDLAWEQVVRIDYGPTPTVLDQPGEAGALTVTNPREIELLQRTLRNESFEVVQETAYRDRAGFAGNDAVRHVRNEVVAEWDYSENLGLHLTLADGRIVNLMGLATQGRFAGDRGNFHNEKLLGTLQTIAAAQGKSVAR